MEIPKQTSMQKFKQHNQFSQIIASKFGYQISSEEYDQQKSLSNLSSKKIILNNTMNPLKIEDRRVEMSEKHKQILKQIQAYQFNKKMLLLQKKKSSMKGQQYSMTKKLNDKIKQYNYLIQHKHFIQKDSEDTKIVLKLKPNTEAENIILQIKNSNKKLHEVEDLKSQFNLNKKINSLYRTYKDKMYGNIQDNTKLKSLKETVKIKKRIIPSKNSLIANKTVDQQNHHHSQINTNMKQQPQKNNETRKMHTSIISQDKLKDIFMPAHKIKQNQQFNRKSTHNKQLMNLYKTKISFKLNKSRNKASGRISNNNQLNRSEGFIDKNYLSGNNQQFQFEEEENKYAKPEMMWKTKLRQQQDEELKQKINQTMMNQFKEKKKLQEKCFSLYLEKKNRKYKKPWGNKILIKYDCEEQAKQMLGTQGKYNSPGAQSTASNFQRTENLILWSNKKQQKYQKSQSMNDEDKWVIERMLEEQNDEKYYQTMCKNQKINLYLKSRKNKS